MTSQNFTLKGVDHTTFDDQEVVENRRPQEFGEKSHDRLFTSEWLFQSAGDIIELDAWVPEDIIEQINALNTDEANFSRHRGYAGEYGGEKQGYEYNFVPQGWGLPEHATTLGSLIYNRGGILEPHRDKWKGLTPDGRIMGDSFRMICHINHTNPHEFTFVVDGQIFKPEPGRWYAINTRKVHYGFSMVDGVYHLSCDLKLEDENRAKTVEWLMDVLPYAQNRQDRKGVWCSRN